VSEPKPIASLSSGLLARKGAARPAMRPQGFQQVGANLEDLGWNDMGFEPPKPAVMPVRDEDHDAFGEDLEEHPRVHPTGLTPVASPVHPAGLTPVASPVHSQQAEIADRLSVDGDDEEFDEAAEPNDSEAQPEPLPIVAPPAARAAEPALPRRAPAPRAARGSKGKAAFTLRLDPDRHLKLRLACAVDGRSAQQIVTDAVDQFLAEMPELDGLAQKAKRRG
jgi:hypothetical protein